MSISWTTVNTCLLASVGLLGFLIIAAALWLHRRHQRYQHIPGPKRTSFWLGNYDLMQKAARKETPFYQLGLDLALTYGKTYCIWVFWIPVVVTIDSDAIKELLIPTVSEKPKLIVSVLGWVFGYRFLGNGLDTDMNHKRWLTRRKAFENMFRRSQLQNQVMTINAVADNLMEVLKMEIQRNGNTVDLMDLLGRTTADIGAKFLLTSDIADVRKKNCHFHDYLSVAFEAVTKTFADPISAINPLSNRAYKKRVGHAVQTSRFMLQDLYKQRLEEIREGKEVPADLITLAIKIVEKQQGVKENYAYDLEVVIDDIITLFVGAEDTTAGTLCFLLYVITTRSEIMCRLMEEIEEIVGHNTVVKYDDIAKMTYLRSVFKETLRIYGVSPFIARQATEDMIIGGFVIPKGTIVPIHQYAAHHYPEYFDNPDEFIPERFQPDAPVSPYTYLPFSLGPRNCIGVKLAQMVVPVIIVKLLRNFEITWDHSQVFHMAEELTLKLKSSRFILKIKEDKQ